VNGINSFKTPAYDAAYTAKDNYIINIKGAEIAERFKEDIKCK